MSVDLATRPAVRLTQPLEGRATEVLTGEALAFLAGLHRRFNDRRLELLALRDERQTRFDAGAAPDFLAETAKLRAADWTVGPIPADLAGRWVKIAGPVDRQTIVEGLNSEADLFVADFEDATSPSWVNLLDGQANLKDRWTGRLALADAARGATLIVRPRGWHLPEAHALVDGEEMSAALFDVGLYLFHNAQAALARGSGPYLDLPKMESHLEARLWQQVFAFAEADLGLPPDAVKATVLIETLPAAFEMDEILHELRGRAVGLNFGRRDYVFSFIKRLKTHADALMPDRTAPGIEAGFSAACAVKLVQTCHRRGALANPPGPRGEDTVVTRADLLGAPQGPRTEQGLRENIRVAVHFIAAWLGGRCAVRLDDLTQDAASAETCRAQVWQWIRHRAVLTDGREVTPALFRGLLDEETMALRAAGLAGARLAEAAAMFSQMSLADGFEEFLTLPAYRVL